MDLTSQHVLTYSQFELPLGLVWGDGESDGVPQVGGAMGTDVAGKVMILLCHHDVPLDQEEETLSSLQTHAPGNTRRVRERRRKEERRGERGGGGERTHRQVSLLTCCRPPRVP